MNLQLLVLVAFGVLTSAVRMIYAQEATGPQTPELSILTAFEAGDDRIIDQTFEGVRILARAGAGYEAARVLAAIAVQAEDSEFGHVAREQLERWGLTVDIVQDGDPAAINETIANHRGEERGHSSDQSLAKHFQNLIQLGLLEHAADRLLSDRASHEDKEMNRLWGETLERYHIPHAMLKGDQKEALLDLLKGAQRHRQLRLQAYALWTVDHEAAEIAHRIFRRYDSHGNEEAERDEERHEEEHGHFARWVERDQHHREEREEESAEELLAHAVQQALRLSNEHPKAAATLAALVIHFAPDSLAGNAAAPIAAKLEESNSAPTQPHEKKPQDEDDFFAINQVHEYRLEVSDEAIAQWRKSPKDYARATFYEGDTVYQNVGVRLKGGWGSFRMFDGKSKAAFTIKFNEFEKGQRFHGLRRIVLNNAVQDPSYLHEYLGYSLFRDAGIPAPRIAFANLHVNGERYGLYVQAEAVTKDFLTRWFEKTKGNLYEGPGDVLGWEELDLDSNQEKDDRSDLRKLASVIEAADDDDPWDTLAEHIDIDTFAKFLALEQLLNHWDGYTQTNNYRMYHDPDSEKFHFIPHGADQLFENLRGNVFRQQGGILGRALLQTDAGKERFHKALRTVLDTVWNEEFLRQRIAEVYLLVRAEAGRRPRKGRHDLNAYEHHVARMLRFISLRRLVVEAQLKRSASPASWREPNHEGGELHSFLFHDEGDD